MPAGWVLLIDASTPMQLLTELALYRASGAWTLLYNDVLHGHGANRFFTHVLHYKGEWLSADAPANRLLSGVPDARPHGAACP